MLYRFHFMLILQVRIFLLESIIFIYVSTLLIKNGDFIKFKRYIYIYIVEFTEIVEGIYHNLT